MRIKPTYSYYPIYLYGNPLADQSGLGVTHFSANGGEKTSSSSRSISSGEQISADLPKNKESSKNRVSATSKRKAA